jgi:hypothetical protein
MKITKLMGKFLDTCGLQRAGPGEMGWSGISILLLNPTSSANPNSAAFVTNTQPVPFIMVYRPRIETSTMNYKANLLIN